MHNHTCVKILIPIMFFLLSVICPGIGNGVIPLYAQEQTNTPQVTEETSSSSEETPDPFFAEETYELADILEQGKTTLDECIEQLLAAKKTYERQHPDETVLITIRTTITSGQKWNDQGTEVEEISEYPGEICLLLARAETLNAYLCQLLLEKDPDISSVQLDTEVVVKKRQRPFPQHYQFSVNFRIKARDPQTSHPVDILLLEPGSKNK